MIRDDDIFAQALARPPAERPALLARSCTGDPDQRSRIESLLEAYAAAGDFLEVSTAARSTPPPDEQPGDTLVRYTLVRQLGEGGCGTVYLAEQKEPVRRRVALKVIKLGMDTRSVIARFEGERQALAMMDHPDIARVFDAGATDAGRPFFVMEFVDGVPITKFCDEHRLPLAARLELFARVCLALQHAHQKGVIHRDIKPSNILVALHDGVPAPKVIDFGIAKATQDRLTDHTLVTGLDQFIGTPAYMSPEQADRRDRDVDTRSDVYALGVLLYELLCGRPPFDPRTFQQAGVDEIRRIIREVDPPRPSARFAALTEADRRPLALARGTAPAPLAAALRGDLDWIAMRCLEKDRARRYGSAQDLADDLRRCLRQEPVEARPPSTLYLTQRFVARHRLACASAAAIALTLVAATVVSVRQAVLATRATRAEALARADAQRRQDQAEDLLTFMLGDFRTELKKIGRLQLLDTVGEKATAYFAALDPRDLTDTALARQARALTQIGETRMEEARYDEAAAAFTSAYQRATALAARHPRDGDMLFERAQAEYWIGFVARRRGDYTAAREWFTRYRDSAAALAEIEGNTIRAQREITSGHRNLAVMELEEGNLTAARMGFEAERAAVSRMLLTSPEDVELRSKIAGIASWLGSVADRDGNYAEAGARFAEAAERYDELAKREPAVSRWRLSLAQNVALAGDVQVIVGRSAAASAAYDRAEALLSSLVTQDPKNQQWLVALLNVRLQQVALLLTDADLSSAGRLLAQTRSRIETLVLAEPSSRIFTRLLAAAWWLESRLLAETHAAEADRAIARALELGEPLVKESRANNRAAGEFAQSCLQAGRLARARGQADEAARHWQRALAVLTPRLAGSHDWRLLDPAAQALVLLGRPDEARPLIERLQRSGYHALDPQAASTLGLAPPSPSSIHPH